MKLVRCLKIYFSLFVLTALVIVGCDNPPIPTTDVQKTIKVAKTLEEAQPTPTDIDCSLERYNLIKRAYWVNGQREKANTVTCEITKPLGYVVLFSRSGAVINKFVVDGKVSSLNSYLTPDSEYYERCGNGYHNKWLADVDGSYGENSEGIFFFDVNGHYWEWTGEYLYTDVPVEIDSPVIKFSE